MYRITSVLKLLGSRTKVANWARATRAEADGLLDTLWESLIDQRLTDLRITVKSVVDGEIVADRCLDDAQLYYDHRMYRIGRMDRWRPELDVPIERRSDPRDHETCVIIGFRDNLDCTIHQRLASPSPAITSEYLDELWSLRESC